jgi:plastocyanin
LWIFKLGGNLAPRAAAPPPPTEYGFTGIVADMDEPGSEIALGAIVYRQEHVFNEYMIKPLRAHVTAGREVNWTNYGTETQTIEAEDGSWTTGEIRPGQSAAMGIRKPGTYVYHYRDHPWVRAQLEVR